MMTSPLVALIADYGVFLVFAVTFLSCLAIPVPSSLVMLAAGGFAASGDLALGWVACAAFAGAVMGDNGGYWIARFSGTRLSDWLAANPKRAGLYDKSEAFMNKWGGSSVFFSCWLVAPLGPYVNYVSGLTRFTWIRFAMWGALGEVVWVTIYVGLGYTFADQITALSTLLGNVSGLIVALLAVGILGWWLIKASRAKAKAT